MLTAIFGFLQAILPGFFGTAVQGVVTVVQSELAAKTSQETLDEDLAVHQVAADVSEAGDQAQMVVADEAHPFTRNIRPLFGLVTLYALAIAVVVNTALEWRHIAPIPMNFPPWVQAILSLTATSYLGHAAVQLFRPTSSASRAKPPQATQNDPAPSMPLTHDRQR